MYRIGIAKFIASPAVLFDLLGCAEPTEAGSEPCRIRIGPDQFLDIHVFPTQFKYDLWAELTLPTAKAGGFMVRRRQPQRHGSLQGITSSPHALRSGPPDPTVET